MTNYDFKNLSPLDFEVLVKDLLEAKLKINLENFIAGPDGGVDLRYCYDSKNELVIQCKNYFDFNQLLRVLKKEVKKVRELKPKRYIVATSVGLTRLRKAKIHELFKPFMRKPSDVYGASDLNSIISKNKDIERSHFKLWLSSTNILNTIVHSKVVNQSRFEMDRIKDAVKVYVPNESFNEALNILQQRHAVVICGIPGIGKSTLSRILAYHYLANGFDEFIYISNSISEAYELYEDGKKQVFFFDDFLGKRLLEENLETNEDQNILRFMEKVADSEDKILILATREYILNQAKEKFENLNQHRVQLSKCILDLKKYTNFVRAKILYNHLFFSKLPEKYIENLVYHKNFLDIIKHRNYNPRIVHTITQDQDVWKNISPENFYDKFIEYLDKPFSIWEHVFSHQISPLSQALLLILAQTDTPILKDDLADAVSAFGAKFGNKYGFKFNERDFEHALRECENTFITIDKDPNNHLYIDFQNPSIQDFLILYISQDEKLTFDLITAAHFFNQAINMLSKPINKSSTIEPAQLKREVKQKVMENFAILRSSGLTKTTMAGKADDWWWSKANDTELSRLNILFNKFGQDQDVRQLIKERIIAMDEKKFNNADVPYYVNLLAGLGKSIGKDPAELIKNLSSSIYFTDGIDQLERLSKVYPKEYRAFIKGTEFSNLVDYTIDNEMENTDDDGLEELRDNVQSLQRRFNLDLSEKLDTIQEMLGDARSRHYAEMDPDDYRVNYDDHREISDGELRAMFDTLRTGQK